MDSTALIQLTILNSMADQDFLATLDQHVAWNLKWLDLKASIFGQPIDALPPAAAERAREEIDRRQCRVYCFSTSLFHHYVEDGPAVFRQDLEMLTGVLESARILRPTVIRLLSAKTRRRGEIADSAAYLNKDHSWIFDFYREAVDRIVAAGLVPMIENEAAEVIFSKPDEILDFFSQLDRPAARLIWDIGNFWQMGTYPSVAVYEKLAPLIGGVHAKGGLCGDDPKTLQWASSLRETSWPVLDIVGRAVADRVTQTICVNSPHGQRQPGFVYRDELAGDLQFLRQSIPGIAP